MNRSFTNSKLFGITRRDGLSSALMVILVPVSLLFFYSAPTGAATFTKADNTTDLNLAGSWTQVGVPGNGDIALWDGTFSSGNNNASLGTNMFWNGVVVSNNLQNSFTINASGTNALTIGTAGINMSNANQAFTFNCPVIEGGVETWNVNAGQSLTFSASVTGGTSTVNNTYNLTMTGAGTVNFNGNYSDGGNQGQTILVNSNTININPGMSGLFVSGKKVVFGNIAGSLTTVNIQSGTNLFYTTNYVVMADNATATSILNITGGQTTINNTTYPFVVGLKGTGVVNVASSVLILGPSCLATLGSYTSSGTTGADGTLNINNGGTVVVSNSAQYFALGNGGPSSYGNGHVNLNTGGTLVCGRNIIKNNSSAKGYVTFNGGILKVATNSASFMQGLTAAWWQP